MARWTTTHADVIHMATVPKEIPMAGIVEMRLKNGAAVEGVIRRMNFGNNAGQGGWQYYGEYEIETIDKNAGSSMCSTSSPQRQCRKAATRTTRLRA